MRKKLTIQVRKEGSWEVLKSWGIWVQLDSDCMFYCYPPDEFLPLLGDPRTRPAVLHRLTHRKKTGCFGAKSFEDLEAGLQEAAKIVARPEVIVERVIRYTITTTSRYAKNAEGEIAPNARDDGFQWVNIPEKQFGRGKESAAGLLVGAGAFKKTTTKLGEREDTKFDRWYGVDENEKPYDHWSRESPAGELNHWSLNCRAEGYENEMPYSDEAAIWFIGTMKQIAILSDRVLTRFAEGGIQSLMNGRPLLEKPQERS